MSADLINAQNRLNVFEVHGVNWSAVVPMDEYNSQFPLEDQSYEAASRALAAFKGKDTHGIIISLDEGEDAPLLGPTMIAFLQGTDPNKGFIPFSYIVLANEGYYKESVMMEDVLNKELEAIQQDQLKNEAAQARIAEQVKKLKNKPK